MKRCFCVVCLLLFAAHVVALDLDNEVFYGPMLHFEFTGHKSFAQRFSYSFEVSYWVPNYFCGVDAGIEVGSGKLILYSEAEAGIFIAGLSWGPYINFLGKDKMAGFQTTLWGNWFWGFDLRWRSGNGYLGTYGKLPVNESTGHYSHHHDLD